MWWAEENVFGKYSVFFLYSFQSHWAKLEEGSQVEDTEPLGDAGARASTKPGAATGRGCR